MYGKNYVQELLHKVENVDLRVWNICSVKSMIDLIWESARNYSNLPKEIIRWAKSLVLVAKAFFDDYIDNSSTFFPE